MSIYETETTCTIVKIRQPETSRVVRFYRLARHSRIDFPNDIEIASADWGEAAKRNDINMLGDALLIQDQIAALPAAPMTRNREYRDWEPAENQPTRPVNFNSPDNPLVAVQPRQQVVWATKKYQ
jgi:hypothetical protein